MELTKLELIELQRAAFMYGAEWWEFTSSNCTMWQSDQRKVYMKACEVYKITEEENGLDKN